eukprot:TRINITY_DN19402_c0_g2_i1.p1 TRINITY_DN19402_c0_g2~~TRINITY_DN19402_c0_g2_i1.p1  ORF type:complete len:752 (+),score=102.90 TRINITY_DN19402_c0_g2_i1:339-2594(+)
MVSVNGLIISISTAAFVFTLLLILFWWLSRYEKNYVIYYPALLIRGLPVPRDVFKGGLPYWLWEALFTSEDRVLDFAGLDSAVYSRFLSTAWLISVAVAVYGLGVLLPICATDDNLEVYKQAHTNFTFDKFDEFTIINVADSSPRLWAFVGGGWWMTLCTLFLLYRASESVADMVVRNYKKERPRPWQFTILVRDIPPPERGMTRQEQVDDFFKRLYPDTFAKSVLVLQLRQVLKVWNELQNLEKKKSHAEAWAAAGYTRQTVRAGFLGIKWWRRYVPVLVLGAKVDAIEYYEESIEALKPKLEWEQMRALRQDTTAAAFVFFKTRVAATQAAQTHCGERGDEWAVTPAPDPRGVRWGDVSTPLYRREGMRFFVRIIIGAVIVLFSIPVSLTAGLAGIGNLRKFLPFLEGLLSIPSVASSVQAYLPQVVLYSFLAFMPYVFLTLTSMEAFPSEPDLWRSTTSKIFYLLVLNVFLIFTLTGSVVGTIQPYLDELKEFNLARVFNLLGSQLPPNASFFISYVALIFYVGYGLEISRLIPFIYYKLGKSLFFLDKAEDAALWAPAPIAYYLTLPQDLLICTLGLSYAAIAPLILLFTTIYYSFAYVIYRHQILNVYTAQWEGGGHLWHRVERHVLAALVIGQLTLIGYFGLQLSPFLMFLVPLPIIAWVYSSFSNRRYVDLIQCMPLSVVRSVDDPAPSLPLLVQAYTPECMRGSVVYEALGEPEAATISSYVPPEGPMATETDQLLNINPYDP